MLRIGTLLYGYCGGYFGDSYDTKRIEAIGTDWVVARELGEDKLPLFCNITQPENLERYMQKEDD